MLEHIPSGGKINLTLNTWSSSTQVSFLGITGHFIEADTCKFQSLLLVLECLRRSYSVDSVARVPCSVLHRFQLSSHIRAITLDNPSVNTKMLTILQDDLTGFTLQDG